MYKHIPFLFRLYAFFVIGEVASYLARGFTIRLLLYISLSVHYFPIILAQELLHRLIEDDESLVN